jgi:flagellar motor switch protein FliN
MAVDEVTGVLDEVQAPDSAVDNRVMDTPTAATAGEQDFSPPSTMDIAGDLADTVSDVKNLDMLLDVNLRITVELGRTQMKFRDVLNLSSGSIVELAKQTSEPVDILVNGALLATGEVVVMDDHFAVRITKLLNRVERLKKVL